MARDNIDMFQLRFGNKGFSLIELLVVIIIIPIMAGLSIAQFNRQTQEVKLDKQSDQIVDVLELAKKKALTGDLGLYSKIHNPPDGCPNFAGYVVRFTGVSPYTGYALNICCAATCNNGVASYSTDSSLTVTVSGPQPIQFTPLTPGTAGGANTVITVRNPTTINKCISITVSPAGIITKGNKAAC